MTKVMHDPVWMARWRHLSRLAAGVFAGAVLGMAAVGSLKLAVDQRSPSLEAPRDGAENALRTMAAIVAADRAANAELDSRLTEIEWRAARLQTMAAAFLHATDPAFAASNQAE